MKGLNEMDIKQKSLKQSIVEICDHLIEDAQRILMNQTEHTNTCTFNLSDYTGYFFDDDETKKVNKEIIDHLIRQEIRLYEDECDENGMIINSIERFTNIFEDIEIVYDHNNISIHLFFSQEMMDLLT